MIAKEGITWPQVGDVVLIHDNWLQSRWKLGMIISLHEGQNTLAKVVDIKTFSGITTHPIARLYPLEQSGGCSTPC